MAVICVRSAIAAALLLVVAAATAGAECAWVLWVLSTGDAWEPIEAWPAGGLGLVECQRRVTENRKALPRLQELERQGQLPKLPGPAPIDWRCLPDTVDPRGPKGGGR